MSGRKGVVLWILAAAMLLLFVLNSATGLPPLPKSLESARQQAAKAPPISNTTVYRGRPPYDQHPLMPNKGKVKNLVIPVLADDDPGFRSQPLWPAPWLGRMNLIWVFEAAGNRRQLPGGGGATGIEAWGSYDRDGDGLPDAWERIQQPRLYEASTEDPHGGGHDPDGDDTFRSQDVAGTNLDEYNWGTDPRNTDTDGDGLPDGYEITYGLDPLDDGSKPVPDIPPEILALYPNLHGVNMNGADGDPDVDDGESDGGTNIVEAFAYQSPTDPNENTILGNAEDPDGQTPPAPVSNVLEFFFFGTLEFNGYSDLDNDVFVPAPSPWPGAPLPGMLTTECPDDTSRYFRTPSGALRPSNPLDPDTDDDGLPDGWEIWYYAPGNPYGGPNPLDDGRTPDVNGETHPACGPDGDPDLDGLTNAEEFLMGTAPSPAATSSGRGTESVKSYFADMSRPKFQPSRATEFYYGQFQIESFVAPYVILTFQKSYYARYPERMIEEALRQLEEGGFNYSLFDANNDGWIDNLCIVHQGRGQELTGNPDHILSGTYYLDQPVEVGHWKVETMPDPLNPYAAMGFGWSPVYTTEEPDATYRAQRAIILPEILQFYDAGTGQQAVLRDEHLSIGPACYEIARSIALAEPEDGRQVGLPDLFDNDPGVQDAGAGIGDWGLMGTGAWNYVPGQQQLGAPTPGDLPAPLSPWEKIKLGWVIPKKLEMDGRWKELTAHFLRREILWAEEGMPPGEYLLVEVKMKQGFVRFMTDPVIQPAWSSPFDQPLPIPTDIDPGLVGLLQDSAFTNSGDGGILVWHIDDNVGKIRDNNVNTGIGGRYRVALMQADGLNDLENYDPLNLTGNTADEGDLFPILNFPDPNEPGRQVDMSFDSFQRTEELSDGRVAVYPTTDSYTDGDTQIRFAHIQRGPAFEVSGGWPPGNMLWADSDHEMFHLFWDLNHRYLWFSVDKDRPAIVVKKPNGYLYRYPYLWPNGDEGPYGDSGNALDQEELKTVGTNEIWWDATDSVGPNVRIDLYENDDLVFTIANSVPNTGFYAWTVSQAAREVLTSGADEFQSVPVYSSNYLLKISDASDASVYDYSDDYFGFSDADNDMVLGAVPTSFQDGTAVAIAWTADSSIERVNVELYFQGQLYETIAQNLLNTGPGSVSWTPGTVPLEIRNIGWNIRVSDASNPNVFVENPVSIPRYTVAPNYADVVLTPQTIFWTLDATNQPLAQPVIVAGKPVEITWTTTHPTTYTVNINLYQNDRFLRYLRQEYPNVGRFVWFVPLDLQAGDYRIKIVSSQSAALADNYAFSAEFSVLPAAWIVYPAGGAELNALNWDYKPFGQLEFTDGYSIANIIFASAISNPNLTYRLEYLDAGGVWRQIPGASSIQLDPAQYDPQTGFLVATRGNFPWDTSGLTIPECRVRIICNQNPSINHQSGRFVVDHTPPKIVGLRFGSQTVNPLPPIAVDPNDPLSPIVAENVDVHAPIEITFNKQMDRENYSTQADVPILHWPWSTWYKLTVSEVPLVQSLPGSDPDAPPGPADPDLRSALTPATVTWSGTSLIYYRQEPWAPNAVYYVYVWRDARDKHKVGNEVGIDYAFCFVTADFEPPSVDTDRDGIPDDVEKQYPAREPGAPGLNPFLADAQLDADGDGVSNAAEIALGMNPILNDSDRDGMPDGWELSWGFDPIVDDAWVDYDGDRLTNIEEFKFETDPTDPNSPVTVYVDAANDSGFEDGSQEHPWTTIQKGINNALAPAIVVVADGLYEEHIKMKNGIALFSATRYGATIQGTGAGTVATVTDVPVARIDWFVITGGNGFTGGGISCVNSPIVISRNKITANTTQRAYYDLGGGGIYLEKSDAVIRGNEILRNNSVFLGGGILSLDSSPLIIGNVIAKNVAEVCGGAAYIEHGSPILTNNTIMDNVAVWGNYGGVFYHHGWNVPAYTYRQNDGAWYYYNNPIYNYRNLGYPLVVNCIIRGNGRQLHGIPLSGVWYSNLESNIFGFPPQEYGLFPWEYSIYFEKYWDFDIAAFEGYGSAYWEGYDSFTDFYFDFYTGYRLDMLFFGGLAGQDYLNFNIDEAPLFKDRQNDDYHLRPGSTDIDAGTDPTAFSVDIDDELAPVDGDNDSVVVTDIGADEFVDSDWDNLPDYWERLYFGDLTHDGTTDTNRDGQDDLTEYEGNEDPTAPRVPDQDGDGMPDSYEQANGLDPAVNDADADLDGDGLTNIQEYRSGTDPQNPDTDGDGLTDADEVIWAPTNPLNPDTDGDELNDGDELLVHNSDPLNPDTDGDGYPDGYEIQEFGNFDNDGSGDADNDGLTDLAEYLRGTDPTLPDTDGDTLSDAVETNTRVYVDANDTGTDPLSPDTDGDGWLDAAETNTGVYVSPDDTGSDPNSTDGDHDGLPDTYEIGRFGDYSRDGTEDLDGDGLTDIEEFYAGTDPTNPDTDGDGLSDGVETNTGVFIDGMDTGTDPLEADTDGDGLSDGVETNTGVFVDENDTGTNPLAEDTDRDGLEDNVETNTGVFVDENDTGSSPLLTDTDGDKLLDDDEVFLYGTDPNKADTDGDGLSDKEEIDVLLTDMLSADTDGDGLSDFDELFVYFSDPFRTDTDKDGLPDKWEIDNFGNFDADGKGDADGDGLTDLQEFTLGTDPNNSDTDGDGLSDPDEVTKYNTDPTKADTDDDGLSDRDEIFVYNTNPTNPDMDNDGLSDGDEILVYGSLPRNWDTDGDGMSDGFEIQYFGDFSRDGTGDFDGDRLTDLDEFLHGTNPGDDDTDDDGLKDNSEISRGTDPLNPDTDGDGLLDGQEVSRGTKPLDPDTDDDGLFDGVETDTGIFVDETDTGSDPKKFDTDGDLLSDGDEVKVYGSDPNKPDTDGDGMPDWWEADRDQDGVSDLAEVKLFGTDPRRVDTDGDEMPDWYEIGLVYDPNPLDPLTDDAALNRHAPPDNENNLDEFLNLNPTPPAALDPATDDAADDRDGDGTNNLDEFQNSDTDNDGLTNNEEVTRKPPLDPLGPDMDDDGLTDGEELNRTVPDPDDPNVPPAQIPAPTNPRNADTDSDGMPDGYEVFISTLDPTQPLDPLVRDGTSDRNSDGETNLDEYLGYDQDGDGLTTDEEVNRTIPDPNDPNIPPNQIPAPTNPLHVDTDRDGLVDGADGEVLKTDYPKGIDADNDTFVDGEEDFGTDPLDPDTDGDGLPDWWEVSRTVPNPNPPPPDIPAPIDPTDPTGVNGPTGDFNGDGVPNIDEYLGSPDADGDGILNIYETNTGVFVDANDTGTDPQNRDSDDDTLPDGWEVVNGTDPNAPTGVNGPDGDIDGDGITNFEEYMTADTDNDGLRDIVETNTGVWGDENDTGTDPGNPDTDGDTLLDGVETNTRIYVDANDTGTNPLSADTDGDGMPDWWEVSLAGDPAPLNPSVADDAGDRNGDGETNLAEFLAADSDRDTLTNGTEITLGTNPLDPDTDGDGMPDWWEVSAGTDPADAAGDNGRDGDIDGDGITNYVEYATTDSDLDGLLNPVEDLTGVFVDVDHTGTSPLDGDTDDDLLPDYDEVYVYPTDPNNPDTDNDGLTDFEEIRVYFTDPMNPDTDGDGMSDGDEIAYPSDPFDPDLDRDSLPDGWEFDNGLNLTVDDSLQDADGDGVSNVGEYVLGTDPNDAASPSRLYFVNAQTGDDAWDGTSSTYNGGTDGPKRTIQATIEVARTPAIIRVAAGNYVENLTLRPNIALLGEGEEVSVIVAAKTGNVVSFDGVAGVIDGFTIAGAQNLHGAKVYAYKACVVITNNLITSSLPPGAANARGVGIYCNSSPMAHIARNRIIGNYNDDLGGGIFTFASSANIRTNLIADNTAILGGGGICVKDGSPEIINNTVANNLSGYGAGGILVLAGSPHISNCILWGNGDDLEGVSVEMINHCDIQDGDFDGERGNFSLDPLFKRPSTGVVLNNDYRLRVESPCIDAATSAYVPTADLDGEPVPFNYIRRGYYWFYFDGVEYMSWTAGYLSSFYDFATGELVPDIYDYVQQSSIDVDIGADEVTDTDFDDVTDEVERNEWGTQAFHIDTDNDGMPDRWENDYGFDPLVDDGQGNADGDAFTNVEEWIFGTNPGSSSSPAHYFYVNAATGNDAWDGTRARYAGGTAGPKATIQAGVDAATALQDLLILKQRGYPPQLPVTVRERMWQGERREPAVVLVASGTYNENVTMGEAVALIGAGFDNTIINAPATANAVTFSGITIAKLSGFTIAGGDPPGAKVFLYRSPASLSGYADDQDAIRFAPVISHNRITGRLGTQEESVGGTGIYCSDSSCIIAYNEILWNHSQLSAGGIFCSSGSQPLVVGNRIFDNATEMYGGAVCLGGDSAPVIARNVMVRNTALLAGGAIYVAQGSPRITNNTLVDNSDGIFNSEGSPVISNCILWGNGDDLVDNAGSAAVTYCDIQDGDFAGFAGNISRDPVFKDAYRDDYHLRPLSPCVDAGRNVLSNGSMITSPSLYTIDVDLENSPFDGNNDGAAQMDIGADEMLDVDRDQMLDSWERQYFGGLGRNGTADADRDGLNDLDEFTFNGHPLASDADHDRLTDYQEAKVYGTAPNIPDTDADGASDFREVQWWATNWNADYDRDGVINILDPDSDGDGIADGYEMDNQLFTSINDAGRDRDSDGLTNLQEYQHGTDPNKADTDGDGISDGDEVSVHATNPLNPDTDGDGLLDGLELVNSTDPFNPDTDGDGMPDGWEAANSIDPLTADAVRDPDGDRLLNIEEYRFGTNPHDASSPVTTYADDSNLGSQDGSKEYPWGTLGLAIQYVEAVMPGKPVVIEVAEGTYNENLVVPEKVFLKGAGADKTQINGGGNGVAVTFANVPVAKIDGFTITGGRNADEMGGGIYCFNSKPVISNNVIRGNVARWGGGIGLKEGSDAVIFNNVIMANTANMFGGGIACDGSSPTVTSCTVVDNTATFGGGGIYNANGTSTVANCILWGNGWELSGISLPMIGFSNIEDGNFRGQRGNVSADPEFIKGVFSGLYLADNSPCVNAGSASAFALGLEDKTTRLDGKPDSGTADIGFHYSASDVVRVVGTASDPATGGVIIYWTSKVGKSYQVHYADGLGPAAAWKPLGDPMSGTGSVMSLKDTGGAGRPAPIGGPVKQRFYRVEEK